MKPAPPVTRQSLDIAEKSLTRTDAVQGGDDILQRIASRRCRVAVIGVGHAGLPLAVETARAGFPTIAFDTDPTRVARLNAGISYIDDVPAADLGLVTERGLFSASGDADVLSGADAIIICVPTPLNKSKHPDNSSIVRAVDVLVPRMRAQQLIVLESTTFPGFTNDVLLPKLSASGLRLDDDFFVAFSPERVDPGNRSYSTKTTPKVIGGVTLRSLEVATALYRNFIDTLVPVGSTAAAEMVKLLENTFRAVNIGLINEVAMMCHKLGLDVWEVIEAASSKPFGFMPFYPGPGIGGHCIPVDPLYLSWKLRTLEYNARFVQLADEINSAMPGYVVSRVAQALNERGRATKGAKILLAGVAYKRDVADVRESPALDIMTLLLERGAEVSYHDPLVAEIAIGDRRWRSCPLNTTAAYDVVVIATDHTSLDYRGLAAVAPLVIDCRDAARRQGGVRDQKIIPL